MPLLPPMAASRPPPIVTTSAARVTAAFVVRIGVDELSLDDVTCSVCGTHRSKVKSYTWPLLRFPRTSSGFTRLVVAGATRPEVTKRRVVESRFIRRSESAKPSRLLVA